MLASTVHIIISPSSSPIRTWPSLSTRASWNGWPRRYLCLCATQIKATGDQLNGSFIISTG